MTLFPDDIWRPLLLATLSGLSTSIGAILAVIRKPDMALMAGLLGVAIGVMSTVSLVELIFKNAFENDAFLVLMSAAVGALAYYLLEPLIPKMEEDHSVVKAPSASLPLSGWQAGDDSSEGNRGSSMSQRKYTQVKSPKDRDGMLVQCSALDLEEGSVQPPQLQGCHQSRSEGGPHRPRLTAASSQPEAQPNELQDHASQAAVEHMTASQKSAGLLRLGLLMALTMTLHNMPEGFAVAFSAFTPLGPVMAIAIALHNIPEGIIIAAPIYAATGSRWKAVGLATFSGLSEPFGALLALLLLHPFLNAERLQYLLAGTGGLMLAVCVIELWPEARNCKNDRGLAIGMLVGIVVMGWTLYADS